MKKTEPEAEPKDIYPDFESFAAEVLPICRKAVNSPRLFYAYDAIYEFLDSVRGWSNFGKMQTKVK